MEQDELFTDPCSLESNVFLLLKLNANRNVLLNINPLAFQIQNIPCWRMDLLGTS